MNEIDLIPGKLYKLVHKNGSPSLIVYKEGENETFVPLGLLALEDHLLFVAGPEGHHVTHRHSINTYGGWERDVGRILYYQFLKDETLIYIDEGGLCIVEKANNAK